MKWKPVDYIVGFLAGTICLMLVMSVMKPMISGEPLSDEGAKQVGGIIIAVIAIVSIYVIDRLKK